MQGLWGGCVGAVWGLFRGCVGAMCSVCRSSVEAVGSLRGLRVLGAHWRLCVVSVGALQGCVKTVWVRALWVACWVLCGS